MGDWCHVCELFRTTLFGTDPAADDHLDDSHEDLPTPLADAPATLQPMSNAARARQTNRMGLRFAPKVGMVSFDDVELGSDGEKGGDTDGVDDIFGPPAGHAPQPPTEQSSANSSDVTAPESSPGARPVSGVAEPAPPASADRTWPNGAAHTGLESRPSAKAREGPKGLGSSEGATSAAAVAVAAVFEDPGEVEGEGEREGQQNGEAAGRGGETRAPGWEPAAPEPPAPASAEAPTPPVAAPSDLGEEKVAPPSPPPPQPQPEAAGTCATPGQEPGGGGRAQARPAEAAGPGPESQIPTPAASIPVMAEDFSTAPAGKSFGGGGVPQTGSLGIVGRSQSQRAMGTAVGGGGGGPPAASLGSIGRSQSVKTPAVAGGVQPGMGLALPVVAEEEGEEDQPRWKRSALKKFNKVMVKGEGLRVVKHNRAGGSQLRIIKYDPSTKSLIWNSQRMVRSGNANVPLSSIKSITREGNVVSVSANGRGTVGLEPQRVRDAMILEEAMKALIVREDRGAMWKG